MAKAKAIGSLWVNILARTKPFQQQIQKVQKGLSKTTARFKSVGKAVLKFGSILSGVSIGGMAVFLKQQADALDKIGKTADVLGMSTEAFASWQHYAEKAGISAEEFTGSMSAMTRRIGLFATEGGAAAKRLQQLGFGFRELAALRPENQFIRIAERISKLTTHSERAGAAFEIFGKAGMKMLPLLEKGATGVQEMVEQGKALGIAFSREQIAKVEQFNDAMADLSKMVGGLGQGFVIKVAPSVMQAIEGLRLAADQWDKVGASLKQSVRAAIAEIDAYLQRQFPWTRAAAAGASKAIGWATGVGRQADQSWWRHNFRMTTKAGIGYNAMWQRAFQQISTDQPALPGYEAYRSPHLGYGPSGMTTAQAQEGLQLQREMLEELRRQRDPFPAETPVKMAIPR